MSIWQSHAVSALKLFVSWKFWDFCSPSWKSFLQVHLATRIFINARLTLYAQDAELYKTLSCGLKSASHADQAFSPSSKLLCLHLFIFTIIESCSWKSSVLHSVVQSLASIIILRPVVVVGGAVVGAAGLISKHCEMPKKCAFCNCSASAPLQRHYGIYPCPCPFPCKRWMLWETQLDPVGIICICPVSIHLTKCPGGR